MASNSSEVVNSTQTFFHTDPEKGSTAHLSGGRPIERVITPGGHPIDFSQPAIPVQHRKFGNPLPAGLISFATGFFFLGLMNIGSEYLSECSCELLTVGTRPSLGRRNRL